MIEIFVLIFVSVATFLYFYHDLKKVKEFKEKGKTYLGYNEGNIIAAKGGLFIILFGFIWGIYLLLDKMLDNFILYFIFGIILSVISNRVETIKYEIDGINTKTNITYYILKVGGLLYIIYAFISLF